jgi:thymidylate kinase
MIAPFAMSYANDKIMPTLTPQQQALFDKVYGAHSPMLKYLNVKHDPLVICFSGVSGMGKSTIAQLLEDKYQAVRISSNDIRAIMHSLKINPNEIVDKDKMATVLEAYTIYLMQRVRISNGLIILDASIDRVYKDLFPVLNQLGFAHTVIRLEVPLDIAKSRIQLRDKENAKFYLKHFEKWAADYEAFGKAYKSEIVVNNAEDLAQINKVVKEINKQLMQYTNMKLLHE